MKCFYGTAGGALGDVAPGLSGNFQRITKGGLTAGAGVEAAFTENLTARIQYLYLRLGNATCTSSAACGSDVGLPGRHFKPERYREIFHQHDSLRRRLQIPLSGAQVGANYEFVPWVVGVEASWTDSAISGNTLIGCSGACLFGGRQDRVRLLRLRQQELQFQRHYPGQR